MIHNPCHHCKNRYVTAGYNCHGAGNCKAHDEYQALLSKIRESKHRKSEMNSFEGSVKRKTMKRYGGGK